MAFLAGAIIGTFLLSRVFWLIAWKWPNSVVKAVTLNIVSAAVIIPVDYLAAIHAGNPASLLDGALLYGGCQFLVFLVDLLRMRQQVRSAALANHQHEPKIAAGRKRAWLVWNPADACQAKSATKSGAIAGFVFAGMYLLGAATVFLTGKAPGVGPVDNLLFILVAYVLPSVLAAGLAYWLLRRPVAVVPLLLLVWFLVEVGSKVANQAEPSKHVAWMGLYLIIAAAFVSATRGAIYLKQQRVSVDN